MPYQRQSGFTLVELMVAMAIGTVVILGAGQLFLTTFQTFKKVDELSRKQETVVFAANYLVNQYRKGETDYALASTTNSSTDCSIIRGSSREPLIGGLACNIDDFISPVTGLSGELLDGFHRFTLGFRVDDEEETIESISFHVMERRLNEGGGNGQTYQVGTGDAIIAGGALSGVDSNLLQGESQTSNNLLGHNIPSPQGSWPNNHTGYIENFKNLSDVEATCDPSVISSSNASRFYCSGNINNLNVDGLGGKIIVAENGISLNQSNDASVNNVAVVAGGAININGSNNSGAEFGGVVWSAGSSNLSASGVDFQGSVVAGGAVAVNNASSITADWNTWDLLSVPGYEFSMAEQFNNLETQINVAETR